VLHKCLAGGVNSRYKKDKMYRFYKLKFVKLDISVVIRNYLAGCYYEVEWNSRKDRTVCLVACCYVVRIRRAVLIVV
jgi:hypothetical protein